MPEVSLLLSLSVAVLSPADFGYSTVTCGVGNVCFSQFSSSLGSNAGKPAGKMTVQQTKHTRHIAGK